MNIWLQLILLPAVGALIGWLTNWVAIRMLFRPRRAVGIGRLRVQGLVPRRRHELAQKIGEVVERELINREDVTRRVNTPEFHEAVRGQVQKHVEVFVKEKLYSVPLLGNMAMMDSVANRVRDFIVDEVEKMLPGMIDGFMRGLEDKLEFRKMVTEKVEGFEMERLEGIVLSIARKELRYIEVLGGVLGFAIGLAQFAVIALSR
jgi:uncharacterized membrane protein YheB (UPF0754 family)